MCYRVLHQINLFFGIGVPCFLFAPHMVPYGEYTAQKVYTDRYCTQVYSLLCCFLSLCLLLSRDFPSMVCVWYDYFFKGRKSLPLIMIFLQWCVSGMITLPYTAQPQKQPYRTIWANPVWWSVHDLLFFVSRPIQLLK